MNTSKKNLDGVLLLDKSLGLSSNQALQQVKKLYSAKKAGHTGSLDPLASGMLPICFGEATKFSHFLLDADKTYEVVAKLGEKTTTGDGEGEITATADFSQIKLHAIEKTLNLFRGEISQIPSMFSALKFKGQPLYKLARQGIEVERPERQITIYSLDLIDYQAPLLQLKIHCSKGTYVRTLVEDIGEKLACHAHVVALRRVSVGPFDKTQMHKIEHLETMKSDQELAKYLLSIDSLLGDMPRLLLAPRLIFFLNQGQAVFVPSAPTQGMVQLLDQSGHFIGVGEVLDDGRIGPKRLLRSNKRGE